MKRFIIMLSFLAVVLLTVPEIAMSQTPKRSIGDHFSGEVLRYEVGFWLFDSIGVGVATFARLEDGKYEVLHEGKAAEWIEWLISPRREIYRSVMATINGGKRLVPLLFEEYSIIGKWSRKKTTIYDYGARKVRIEMQKEGRTEREEVDIPEGIIYDSPVTAFYNFRFGVYGAIEPGKVFLFRMVPTKGQNTFRMRVASKEESEARRASEKQKNGKDIFMRIELDKEMLHSKKGELEIWFNRNLVPQSGVVKDVIFFGDIYGRLTGRDFSPTSAKPSL